MTQYDGFVVTPGQYRALLRTLHHMPYGGALGATPVTDAESLVAWLESLEERLADVSARAESNERQLEQYRSDVSGLRRVLGDFDYQTVG